MKFKFEELKVYQKALDFTDLVYQVTEEFPSEERFGLTSQFRRAAVSIALNIAEGASDTDKQFNRFLYISLGSTNECVVCVSIAERQKFINKDTALEIRAKLIEISKMITSLQRHLREKTNH